MPAPFGASSCFGELGKPHKRRWCCPFHDFSEDGLNSLVPGSLKDFSGAMAKARRQMHRHGYGSVLKGQDGQHDIGT